MRGHHRIAYSDIDDDPLVVAVSDVLNGGGATAASDLARRIFELRSPLAITIADTVLSSEGPFARHCALGDPGAARRAVAVSELRALGEVARADIGALLAHLGGAAATPERDDVDEAAIPPAARALREQLAVADDWGLMIDEIARFHRAEGTGVLANRRVLRWRDGSLEGVDDPDPVGLDDLIGGRERRDALDRSLAAFVAGAPPVDALLYGPPGTGKSTVVRALAERHGLRGLRLVQVDRGQIGSLRSLFDRVRGGAPCLVLLDDLVFDEGDRTDRELRGVLEGDVAARPGNVVVWATSNRMRLLHESRTDREDDLESDLGRGERSALATRFGIRVAFPTVGVDEYLSIAVGLAERRGARPDDAFIAGARRFAVDRGLTPRAARQFVDLVLGGAIDT